MSEFREAQVIMLPTELEGLNQFNHLLWYADSPNWVNYALNKMGQGKPQHLYIISDDEIKEGDWCILNSDNKNRLIQCKSLINSSVWFDKGLEASLKYCKKIIATTDTSLKIDNPNYDIGRLTYINLPQPSQQFIEEYIESYNKGIILSDVLVEYELKGNGLWSGSKLEPYEYKDYFLKINPKDNTINISIVNKTYTKEQLIKAMIWAENNGKHYKEGQSEQFNEYIEKLCSK